MAGSLMSLRVAEHGQELGAGVAGAAVLPASRQRHRHSLPPGAAAAPMPPRRPAPQGQECVGGPSYATAHEFFF